MMRKKAARESAFERLRMKMAEISDLRAAVAMQDWDQQVYMPRGASGGRSLQSAALSGILHEKSTSPSIGRLLDLCSGLDFASGSMEAAFLSRTARDYRKSRRIPTRLARRIAEAAARSESLWEQARANADFKSLQESLECLVDLKREYAERLRSPGQQDLYDVLLDEYEPGMTVSELDSLFGILRRRLPPLAAQIIRAQEARKRNGKEGDCSSSSLFDGKVFDGVKQWDFCRFVVSRMGYDWNRGRMDLSEHPFTTNFGLSDVRITSRILPSRPLSCVFSCIHECGHALYDQGIDPALDRTPLADGISLGFHESQSRLWENQIGRSRAFWQFFFPELKRRFPEELSGVELDRFLREVNRVEKSAVRTEADEVTYNLHILLRYDLERRLFDGSLTVKDLRDAWNAGSSEYFGFEPPDDSLGILQDVHWACGLFGYFPTYALGNLMAAQFLEKLKSSLPGMDEAVSAGDFSEILAFLRMHLHRYGAALSPREARKRLFGSERMDPEPFLGYLKEKYL